MLYQKKSLGPWLSLEEFEASEFYSQILAVLAKMPAEIRPTPALTYSEQDGSVVLSMDFATPEAKRQFSTIARQDIGPSRWQNVA